MGCPKSLQQPSNTSLRDSRKEQSMTSKDIAELLLNYQTYTTKIKMMTLVMKMIK